MKATYITLGQRNNRLKKSKSIEGHLSIKLHPVVCYSPMDGNRIADKLNDARLFVCTPVAIHRTITHNRMQFNAYIYFFVFF